MFFLFKKTKQLLISSKQPPGCLWANSRNIFNVFDSSLRKLSVKTRSRLVRWMCCTCGPQLSCGLLVISLTGRLFKVRLSQPPTSPGKIIWTGESRWQSVGLVLFSFLFKLQLAHKLDFGLVPPAHVFKLSHKRHRHHLDSRAKNIFFSIVLVSIFQTWTLSLPPFMEGKNNSDASGHLTLDVTSTDV